MDSVGDSWSFSGRPEGLCYFTVSLLHRVRLRAEAASAESAPRKRLGRDAMKKIVGPAIGGALVLWVSAAAAQTLNFSRGDVRVNDGPRSIVVADFNRDGRPDIATADVDSKSVGIVLNFSTGFSYAYGASASVGAGPFDLIAADFNGDGIPDLAVAC